MATSSTDAALQARRRKNREAQRRYRSSMRSQIDSLTQMNQVLLGLAASGSPKPSNVNGETSLVRPGSRQLTHTDGVIAGTVTKTGATNRCAHGPVLQTYRAQNKSRDVASPDIADILSSVLPEEENELSSICLTSPTSEPLLISSSTLDAGNTPSWTPDSGNSSTVPSLVERNAPHLEAPQQIYDASTLMLSPPTSNCKVDHAAKPAPLDSVTENLSALHQAVVNDDCAAARTLLACGMTTSVQDSVGNTPLHYCALYDRAEMARMLITNGCPQNIKNQEGHSALMLSASMGRFEVTSALIECGVWS